MRQKFVAGNWKMYTNGQSARRLAQDVVKGLGTEKRVDVAVCPPFPYLALVADALRGSPVALGAQDCYAEKEGAFTGEVSPAMLLDVGCQYVILGHSERRHVLGETDTLITRKAHAALAAGLQVILCVGETWPQRQAGRYEEVLSGQLGQPLTELAASGLDLAKLVLAYEPVWAIGTGQNATPEQAQQAHAHIRQEVGRRLGQERAQSTLLLYGGSVKPGNAASLFHQPDVDGGLIGGASLTADHFLAIVRAALPT
jgi:triosephosphate isomerase